LTSSGSPFFVSLRESPSEMPCAKDVDLGREAAGDDDAALRRPIGRERKHAVVPQVRKLAVDAQDPQLRFADVHVAIDDVGMPRDQALAFTWGRGLPDDDAAGTQRRPWVAARGDAFDVNLRHLEHRQCAH
jgi:hypothetical protein